MSKGFYTLEETCPPANSFIANCITATHEGTSRNNGKNLLISSCVLEGRVKDLNYRGEVGWWGGWGKGGFGVSMSSVLPTKDDGLVTCPFMLLGLRESVYF